MAITWTKEWSAADDGTVVSGADLKNIQDDIGSGVEGNATTIQGIAVDAPVAGDDESLLYYDHGNTKFDYVTRLAVLAEPSATVDIDGGTIDGAVIGGNTPAAIDGVAITGTTLKADTSLELATGATVTGILDEDAMGTDSATQLATQQSIKAYVDDSVGGLGLFPVEGATIMAFDIASSGVDLSPLHNALTPTSLAEADIVAGKGNTVCYNMDGSNDYVTIADHAYQDSITKHTIECWFWKIADASKRIYERGANAIMITAADLRIDWDLAGTDIDVDQAHGLDLAGGGSDLSAWHHLVVTMDGNQVDAYINGSSIYSATNGSGAQTDISAVTTVGGAANKWDGRISGFRWLSRVMGATEVLARYNAFK